MKPRASLAAFEAFGIELEYMVVDQETLEAVPAAPEALAHLHAGAGPAAGLDWSNELIAHVIELKNVEPWAALPPLVEALQREIVRANHVLASMGATLMPSAMHPRLDPGTCKLWPDDPKRIYATYDRIFGCSGHGWANLQSMHVNLPFADDDEFARLHAAVRLVLPILPALAASSPLAEGRVTGFLDTRMDAYRANARRIPSIAGVVVPEAVASRDDYKERILAPMYADIAPYDRQGILRHEWLNSRGAIARFDRNAIEIRVLDTQECVAADLAVAAATIAVTRAVFDELWAPLRAANRITDQHLVRILSACIRDADAAPIDHAAYLRLLGYPGERCSASELWSSLLARVPRDPVLWDATTETMLQGILERGPLARRILHAVGEAPRAATIDRVYGELCACLQKGRMFAAAARPAIRAVRVVGQA